MGVQRGGIGVVVVDDRQTELVLECGTEVVALPLAMPEVGAATRRDHPVGSRGSRRVEADPEHLPSIDAGQLDRCLEGVAQRADRSGRALGDTARQLDQTVDQEAPDRDP